MNEKISAGTIARTIILFLGLVNQILALTGHSILPISDEMIVNTVSLIWTIVAAVAAWWKNNSFTKEAIQGDKVMNALRDEKKLVG